MRIFAQEPEAAQKTGSGRPDRVHFGQSRSAGSILLPRRMTGNQAGKPLLQSYADVRQTASLMPAPPGSGFDFSEIRIYSDSREHIVPGVAQTNSPVEKSPSWQPVHNTMHR